MERRVRVPQDKGPLIDRLVHSETHPNGVFGLRADVLVFAAAYGFRHGRRITFTSTLEPIRVDVFERNGTGMVIPLLALAETTDAHVLADADEHVEQRVAIFEEYANGGLELLAGDLQGVDDPLERLLLLISRERTPAEEVEFDLGKLL